MGHVVKKGRGKVQDNIYIKMQVNIRINTSALPTLQEDKRIGYVRHTW